MTPEQATAQCQELATKYGSAFARRIIAQTVHHGLGPDQMERLIHSRLEEFREWMLEAGIDDHDADVAVLLVYLSLEN